MLFEISDNLINVYCLVMIDLLLLGFFIWNLWFFSDIVCLLIILK